MFNPKQHTKYHNQKSQVRVKDMQKTPHKATKEYSIEHMNYFKYYERLNPMIKTWLKQ